MRETFRVSDVRRRRRMPVVIRVMHRACVGMVPNRERLGTFDYAAVMYVAGRATRILAAGELSLVAKEADSAYYATPGAELVGLGSCAQLPMPVGIRR